MGSDSPLGGSTSEGREGGFDSNDLFGNQPPPAAPHSPTLGENLTIWNKSITMKKILLISLLFVNPSFAEMTCDDAATDYFAVYKPNSYTCNSGQYLPANTSGCVSCPNGFTCNGGTFDFNPDYFQGIDFDTSNISTTTINNICALNFPSDIYAIYEPNIHNCTTGYYLPANTDGCQPCPQNNKCVGGTYTFNETLPQGIEQCENGYFAPNGSAVCYPHILHIENNNIYLKSEKATTPSLNVKISNDIFYANMTTIPTTINNTTEQYLKIKQGDTVYYVCDDTICP